MDEFDLFCDMAELSSKERQFAKVVWDSAQRRLLEREEIFIRDINALNDQNQMMRQRIENLSELD